MLLPAFHTCPLQDISPGKGSDPMYVVFASKKA